MGEGSKRSAPEAPSTLAARGKHPPLSSYGRGVIVLRGRPIDLDPSPIRAQRGVASVLGAGGLRCIVQREKREVGKTAPPVCQGPRGRRAQSPSRLVRSFV